MTGDFKKIEELLDFVKNRIESKDNSSYSYSLVKDGLEKINRKVGEEAIEVIISAFNHQKDSNSQNRDELIGEISDLLYHLIVLMIDQNISFEDILNKLNRRNK